MEEASTISEGSLSPSLRIFERLAQLSGYTWDQSVEPYHSSYDNWHVCGIRHESRESLAAVSARSVKRSTSNKSSPLLPVESLIHQHEGSNGSITETSTAGLAAERTDIPVVARVSTHILRIEREHHLTKSFTQTSDPEFKHTVRLIELIRLPGNHGDSVALCVSIFESPSKNYLHDLLDFERRWFPFENKGRNPITSSIEQVEKPGDDVCSPDELSLLTFLDFAIGASECLELLHHGLRVIHGEIRGDAFYFNQEVLDVKIINFGSGNRSFENGLTSSGWLSLSREVGIRNKLQFIAPEQTGRMPAEPESRTDIYSLGILFWIMLTKRYPFDGSSPLEIVQSVLSKRVPSVSSYRMDIPEPLSQIIRRMTQKQIDERYHSTTGLKHDLIEVQRMLGEGSVDELSTFQIGSKDVSSFFVLPINIFGRTDEYNTIMKVVEKVSRRQKAPFDPTTNSVLNPSALASTGSDGRWEMLENGTKSSDTSSQLGRTSPVLGPASSSNLGIRYPLAEPQDKLDPTTSPIKSNSNANESRDSLEIRSNVDGQINSYRTNHHNGTGAFSKRRNSHTFRRRNRCEVISITGAAGLGKSSLLNSIQGKIRRLGYFGTTKFDPARKVPYEPLLRAISSLFRQIFSESDVNSDYHRVVRGSIRTFWPTLHKVLELPESLISLEAQYTAKTTTTPQLGISRSTQAESTDSSGLPSSQGSAIGAHGTSHLLRGFANSTRSLKFMNMLLEVLRVLCTGKLICFSLDDLQFADEESVDLICNIITRKLGMVLIITCREEKLQPQSVKSILASGQVNVTRITLVPLREHEVIEYVAETLGRSTKYAIPLAMLCLERTNGNPFFLKQLLEMCHRKGCLWYSWKLSVWEYDINRVLDEFEKENYGETMDTNFITKRLQDLPPVARAILAWASLLGSSFSFPLVQRLLSGEFDYVDDEKRPMNANCLKKVEVFAPQPFENVVEGLQATLQSYILVPGDTDDHFCFSHDRYIGASAQLRECNNVQKMHFIIVQTMMKYSNLDDRAVYVRAGHLILAASVVKRRVRHRSRFRELLFQAAQKAIESGARPTALQYYEVCLNLMQDDPWQIGAPDVYYEETLNVYTRAADLYFFQGHYSKAEKLLECIFERSHTAVDKAPAWLIQSRIYAANGNSFDAFRCLKTSLIELGLTFDSHPTWETCDNEYKSLRNRLQKLDIVESTDKPMCNEANIILMGAILTEAVSAAYWSDVLLFYQMTIKMADLHIRCSGTFQQSGLGFAYLTTITVFRFGDLSFGSQMNDLALLLLRRSNDPYTKGRVLATCSVFISHILSPIHEHYEILEEATDHALTCGDKHVFLFMIGGLAALKLSMGVNMADLESYCNIGPEDFGDWTGDLRGGVLLIAVRQVARSLQGKTLSSSPDSVMTDEYHDSKDYIEFIAAHASNMERPRDIYNSLMIIPLYLFGHYQQAVEMGNRLLETIDALWSLRNHRTALFYLALSIVAQLRDRPGHVDRDQLIKSAMSCKAQIEAWQDECDVNYLMWSLMVGAEINELTQNYHESTIGYEAAVDHTILHNFPLEQALAFELQAGFFMRRGAKRAARAALLDAIAAWYRIGATGKSEHLKLKNEWVLKEAASFRTADMGIQTADIMGDIGYTQFHIEENERQEIRVSERQTAGDRTKAWVGPVPGLNETAKDSDSLVSPDVSGLGLDILDLQNILEFNQAISSELQVDRLLAQMTEIILESTGAQADFAGVVIQGDGGWGIAASGTPENISSEFILIAEIQDETQKQVLLYTMRFKEVVYVHNVLNDDRFFNTQSAKSVISLPIVQANDLLGVLYLEGQPNSFTDRNLGVLQLLCNQLRISITNALLFKRIRKVSATNTSMIESQKRALAKAREAENKAKLAEAEALRNVKLKEEAARAKSMFLANVSHELRTPLNGVIGMSELLKATPLSKEQIGYADSIRVCADTLLTVINDILDFSKLEAGKMQLFSVPLNLKDTISEVVRALSYTNQERGLETIEELDLDPRLLVMGDPVRLHQIFMNLLSNSYKFTPKGSVTVRSKTEYEDSKEIRVTCSVADTGIGITQEQLNKLFKPFSQADSSTQRSYGGSGLGLSICKALINVLNGKLWLESQLGVGTTVSFTLTFPKAPKAATPNNTEISAKDPDFMAVWSSDADSGPRRTTSAMYFDLTQIPRDQVRVCIAEDNPINQKIAVSFVAKLGIQCQAFNDGLQAVEALRRSSKEKMPFHLVLMDVQMPVLDGYDATRLIRRDSDPAVRGVLIIAMTASAIRGDREKCLEAGMNNYLAKPVRAAVLRSMVEDYLTRQPSSMPNPQNATSEDSASVTFESLPQTERPNPVKKISKRNGISVQPSETGEEATLNSLLAREAHKIGLKNSEEALRPRMARDKSSGNNSTVTVKGNTSRGSDDQLQVIPKTVGD